MKIEVNTHEKNMIRFAAEHSEVVVMSADLGSSCEVKKFRQVYPDRYLTMGIAEQNMCSWAAGMAREGYRPFLHTFAVFLYRRILDQLEMSVAYPNLPVVFVGFVPGITTPGGVTHQSINDVGVLRTVPNMTIFDIGDATEIEGVLDLAYECNGPVYIRMLRKEVPRLFPANEPMRFCAAYACFYPQAVHRPDHRRGDQQEQVRRYHDRKPSGHRRSRHGSCGRNRRKRSG